MAKMLDNSTKGELRRRQATMQRPALFIMNTAPDDGEQGVHWFTVAMAFSERVRGEGEDHDVWSMAASRWNWFYC